MNWLLDINQSGTYVLIGLGLLFIGVIVVFFIDREYENWKNGYYRNKDLLMEKEKLLHRIFRML